jgi:hypothetical protein
MIALYPFGGRFAARGRRIAPCDNFTAQTACARAVNAAMVGRRAHAKREPSPMIDEKDDWEARNLPAADWITIALAVALIASPWLLAFPAGAASTVAVASGVLMGGAALLSLLTHDRWHGWVNFVLANLVFGAVVFIAPIVLRYESAVAIWTYVIVGFAVAALAFVQLWRFTS